MVVLIVLSGAIVVALAVLWWLRHIFVVVAIRGTSMQPTLRPGDRVLLRRAGRHLRLRAGQVAVTLPGKPVHPPTPDSQLLLIKRVVAVPGDPVPRTTVPALAEVAESTVPGGRFVALGDNARSTDSRQLGYFYHRCVLGVVVGRLPRAESGPGARYRSNSGAGPGCPGPDRSG
jgi:signal peptidase I